MIEIVRLSEKDATYYWNAVEALVEKGLKKQIENTQLKIIKNMLRAGS